METMAEIIPSRLGIIGSSGGSALASASECLKLAGKNIEWVVVTDRECGLKQWAEANRHTVHLVDYQKAESFSSKACQIFCDEACDDVLLFYTRRVASPLIDKLRVWNIHPALLPSFKGLHGVKDAIDAGVKILGATLHKVDSGLDTGPIVAQVAAPLPTHASPINAEHISYLQKIWLTLVWFDYLQSPNLQPLSSQCGSAVAIACPGLADHQTYSAYSKFLLRDKI